jgi:TP901 family phage tail tape measure protein
MADLARTVQIIFNATDNTGGVISNIGGNIEGFANKAGNVLAPLDALADKVKLADAAIVGLGLALGGAALIKAGEFGDQINEIGTLFGGSKDQIDAFSQQVQTYAAGSTQSLGDINGAVYAAISAGVKYSDSLAFMADAEKLAIAGKAGLKETTLALVGTLNAYGASTQDAAKYSDVLFQTVKAGQITLPELATGLGQVTGIASSAGIPFADLSAAIAALTSYGIPGAQAITGLKAAIGNIINPSGDAAKAAVELGVGFDAGALKSKGFAAVLADVYKATNGNTGKMTEFFGSIEGLNVALTLGGDKAGKFAGSLDGMAHSTGATAAAFETMKDNFAIVVQQMKNGVDLLLVSIGGPLQDEFAGLAGAFGDVFKNLKVSVDKGAFDPIFAVIGDVEDDLTAFIGKIAQNLPAALDKVDWSKFTAGIQALSDGLGGMFSGLNLDTPEGLAAAMQLAADAAGNLLAQGGGIAESWGDVITNVILPAVKAFAEMSTEMSKNSGEALGWADALSMITGVVGKVGEGLKGIGDGLTLLSGAFYAAIFKSMIPAIEAFGLASLSKSGIVGVFLIIAEVLGKLVAGEGPIEMAAKALYRLATSGGAADTKLVELKDSAKAGADEVAKLGKASDTASAGIDNAAKPAAKLAEVTMAMAFAAGEASNKTEFLAAAQAALKSPTEANVRTMGAAADIYKTTAAAAGDAASASKTISAEYDKLYAATGKVVKTTADYKGAMESASAASKDSAKDLIALAKVAGDYETKLAQIASNEKIKVIESKVKLDIANVEAQAKIATAIIESIGQTYTANLGLIGELMGQLSGNNTFADRTRISLAEQSNKRADELHAAQMKLIAQQIETNRAKAAALVNGTPLISIKADGLKPHLEAFMWEILGAIQVKMAYDGGDMLVGGCSL